MRTLFDVNVLIALLDPRHVHHTRAHRWWARNRGNGWATCPLVENGVVRVLSQTGYPNQVSAAVAVEFLTRVLTTPGHEFWPDDVSLTDQTCFTHDRILGPRQITDLYLLALAVRRGARLATFDKNIPVSVVVAATARNVVVI